MYAWWDQWDQVKSYLVFNTDEPPAAMQPAGLDTTSGGLDMRFLTTVLLVSLTAVPVAQAQSRTMWGFISLGPGAAADSGFYASGIGFGTQRGRRLIMARISSLATPNTKRISDVGVLVGVASAPRRFSFGAAGGLGVATDVKDSAVVALPIEAHASWIMNQNAAIGLRLFGSVNGLANFSGINLNIQIGRLRN